MVAMGRPRGTRSKGDALGTYGERRDFAASPEPPPTTPTAGDRPAFVAQLHHASRTHVDLRLEHRGVLLSWAVPKGPTLAPRARRLAVRTEDHPQAYRWFEGVIDAGYGAGDVMVLDEGWWAPSGEATPPLDDLAGRDRWTDDALAAGRLSFELHGSLFTGRFTLVRTDGEQWLLLHADDDHARAGWTMPDPPRSVSSGRTMAEIRVGAPPTWPAATPDELDALARLPAAGGTWEVEGRTVRVSNLDKVLIPAGPGRPATTKRDLIAHYAALAPALAPYLWARPVNVRRFPDGIEHDGFWQRAVPRGAPEWIQRWPDPDRGTHQVVFDGPASLAWAANLATVEIHPWTSTSARPDSPSWALFDLDPGPDTSWEDLLVLARLHRTALDHLGVNGRPVVTGSRGIHIRVPVRAPTTYAATRAFVEIVSRTVAEVVPDLVSWRWRVGEREGRARLDVTQNGSNRTLATPYGVRARPGAPVAVAIEWDELDDPDLRPDRWTVRTVSERLVRSGDPLAAIAFTPHLLPEL